MKFEYTSALEKLLSTSDYHFCMRSPLAMKRDENSRAKSDENVAVESLSTTWKTSILLMYEIKIQAWLNFNLLRLQTIANIVTIHQISAKVMFQGISGIICYFFCLFFENIFWKYCYEEIIPPIWHKSVFTTFLQVLPSSL